MKKATKFILRSLGIIILLVLIAMVAIPYFYKDEIMAYVKEDINKQVDATVDFKDLSLSLFKSFPDFSCTLTDFSIIGKGDFEGLPLVKASSALLDLDVMSVIKKERDIQINRLALSEPEVNIKVLKNGKANYDIYQSTASEATTEESFDFLANLDAYEIRNGNFTYDDRSGGTLVKAIGITHEGKGQFSTDQFDLETETLIEELSFGNQVLNYINKDRLQADIRIGVDLKNGIYKIKQNDIQLNALKLIAEGEIKNQGEGFAIDLSVAAPGNDFKEVLSIIPGAYGKDFQKVQASGKFRLIGTVRGLYDATKNQLPEIDFELDIDNGGFQYPGMADGFEKIFSNIKLNGDLDNLDKFKIDISKFNFNLQKEPFAANLFLTNIISNPDFKGQIKGKVDLGLIQSIMPLDGVQKLSGYFDADLQGQGTYNQIQNGDIGDLNFGGTARIDQFVYNAVGLPEMKMDNADLKLDPKSLALTSLKGSYGSSGFMGEFYVDNFLAILLPSKTMTGKIKLESNNFDLNELLNFEEEKETGVAYESTGEVFDRFVFDAEIKTAQLQYDIYPLTDLYYRGIIKPNALTIEQCTAKMGKSDFQIKGEINDLFKYLYENQDLTGDLVLQSKVFDLNEFMSFGDVQTAQAKTIANEEEYEPVQLPERTKINIDAKVAKVYYSDLEFKNANGKINIADQAALLNNVKLDAMDGQMIFDGKYDTKDAAKPTFDLKYKMKRVSFGKVFEYLNTFKVLAPIGQYIEGNFDTEMSFKGGLDKDMNPLLDQLSADGFAQTFNAVVKTFPPLEKIGNQLNLDFFKNMPIKNTKNWFEIKDGKMIVQEFKQSVQGIDLLIGGSHGLSQEMNYTIKAKVPRNRFKNQLSGQIDKGFGFLKNQASKIGVDIDQSEFINIGINLTGSIKDPKVKINLLGADGKSSIKDVVVNTVKETAKKAVDSVKTVVTDKVNDEKKELKAKMDKEVEAVMKLAQKQADAARAAGKSAADQARKMGYQQADNLIKKAGNNILKKKAAEIAAKKLKSETDKKVQKIEAEANKKADGIMNKARLKADDIKKKYGGL